MLGLVLLFIGLVYMLSGLFIVSDIILYKSPQDLTIGHIITLIVYLPITSLLSVIFGLISFIGWIGNKVKESRVGDLLNKKIF